MRHPELLVYGIDGAVTSYVQELVRKGKLPNFTRLLKRGTLFQELRPPHPTVTPVCWSAFQTGSTPEINGIVSDLLHMEGPLSHVVSAYPGDHLKAERFWEAAARSGKTSLIASLPVSGPARSPLVRQLEGTSCEIGRMSYPDQREDDMDIPQQLWFFDFDRKPVESLKQLSVKSSPVVPVAPDQISHNLKLDAVGKNSPAVSLGENLYELKVAMDQPHVNRHRAKPFSWQLKADEAGFVLFSPAGEKFPLAVNSWCQPFTRTLETEKGQMDCSFRFGCFRMEDGFLIFCQSAGNVSDRVSPSLLPVLDDLPPVPAGCEYIFLRDPATADLTFDAWNFGIQWHEEFISKAQDLLPSDIVVTYFGQPDTVNHLFWPQFCGARKVDAEKFRFIESCFERVYSLADDYLGFLMDEIADENTTILVLSDHGSIGTPANRGADSYLQKAGLQRWNEDKNEIDWSATRAAAVGYGNIFVNLRGREENGIVPPEEYDKTVAEIIAALQNGLRGPDGSPYLAFAVPKAEAGFFGLGGENCGDVLYGASAGYASVTVHAEQIPTARHPLYGKMTCLGILAGSGAAGGSVCTSPVNLQDLAPTLCAMLGYPVPKDSNGRVLRSFLHGCK